MEKKECLEADWKSKAARYCSMAEHCEAEVREKLFQWQVEEKWHDRVIQYLREEGYINDERYCSAYVHDKVAFQGWGRRKIQMMLQAKKMDGDVIEMGLESIDEDIYLRQLRRLISQRRKDSREKTIRFLLQRGFLMQEILGEL